MTTAKQPTATDGADLIIPDADELRPSSPVELIFDGLPVRIVWQDGEPWFIAADVCHVLALKNWRQVAAVLPDGWRTMRTAGGDRGRRDILLIAEPGLYQLIFTSRKARVRQFRGWVFGEVLPQIRRSGRYVSDAPHGAERTLTQPDQRHMVEVHPADPRRAGGLYGEYQLITLTLPGAGRYIIDALPGRDPTVRLVPLEDLGNWILAEEIRTDRIILSALLQQTHGIWRKFRLLNALDVGSRQIALAEVDKAIVQGGTVAAWFSSILLDQKLKAAAAPAAAA